MADTAVRSLGIRCNGIDQTAGTLSGGNQQKVVIGKWLATRPRVLLLDEPTRGIDVGAKREIYDLIFRLARHEGLAIIVVSSELPELLLLADRILVMSEGRQRGIISRADASEERIMQLAAPQGKGSGVSVLKLISRTKLYWGLMAIFLIGVSGFACQFQRQQHLPVPRQFARRSAAGLDYRADRNWHDRGDHHRRYRPVRRFADGNLSVVCAMLLTMQGDTPAAAMGLPMAAVVALVIGVSLVRFIFTSIEKARASGEVGRDLTLDATRGLIIPVAVGAVLAGLVLWYLLPQVNTKFGVLGVLIVAPCVGLFFGALNGILIVAGRLQPFIVTLAMMVTALGIARLTAGQNNAVLPVYTGTNAVAEFDTLRSLVFGVIPMPGLFFIAAIVIYAAVLRFTPFGRYVYAIGGNEEAARLSGIESGKVKIATYAVSGLLAGMAAVLYVAQYRQGKPDAGAGLELDAIAAVVIGGTSLMGGRGSMAGTFCGVLIFGLLSNILQLHNINSNLQLVLKGLIIIGTVLVQERNAADLLSFLRLPAIRPTQKDAVAKKRPPQETMAHTTGGNAK